jgi:hypothetical protein
MNKMEDSKRITIMGLRNSFPWLLQQELQRLQHKVAVVILSKQNLISTDLYWLSDLFIITISAGDSRILVTGTSGYYNSLLNRLKKKGIGNFFLFFGSNYFFRKKENNNRFHWW